MKRKARNLSSTFIVSLYDSAGKFDFEWDSLLSIPTGQIHRVESPEQSLEAWTDTLPQLIITHRDDIDGVNNVLSEISGIDHDTKPGIFVLADRIDDEVWEEMHRKGAIETVATDTSKIRLRQMLHCCITQIQLEHHNQKLNQLLERSHYHQHTISHIAIALNGIESFMREIENLMDVLLFSLDLDTVLIYRIREDKTVFNDSDFILRTRNPEVASFKNVDLTSIRRMLESIEPDNQIVIQRDATESEEMARAMDSLDISLVNICPLQTRKCLIGSILFATKNERDRDIEMNDLLLTISSLIANAWEKDMSMSQKIEAQGKLTESVRMVEQASKMASLGIMSAGITHEINQPLSAIKVTAESVELWANNHPDELPEKFIKRIKIIHQNANRIDDIIRHMRMNWISATPTATVKINVNQAIREGLTLLERQMKSHGIDLYLQFSQEEMQIEGVKIQFEQIIVNLIVNAIHALDDVDREKKILTISTRKDGFIVIITVEDNGTGFSSDVLEHMFEAFFTTKKAGKGSGLGLAIVKNFVAKFNGRIHAGNVPNGGAKFTIELPCKQ